MRRGRNPHLQGLVAGRQGFLRGSGKIFLKEVNPTWVREIRSGFSPLES